MSVGTPAKASPLVGEVGGGPAASAADRLFDPPPPNPPHKGEGFKRLNLAPDAIDRARDFRRSMTKPERLLWRALREALPEQNWRKQVPLGPYFADFCSHSARLIIEVDGGQHNVGRDAKRTGFLRAEGYRVIRFWNHDVTGNLDGVVESIAGAVVGQLK